MNITGNGEGWKSNSDDGAEPERSRPEGAANGEANADQPGAEEVSCPSNTTPQNRQTPPPESQSGESWPSVVSIDWLELAGCVRWTPSSLNWFRHFEQARKVAQATRASSIIKIGEHRVEVQSRGAGNGKDSHKEFQLKWHGSVVIAISARNDATRQLSNFLLRIPGEGCLVIGAQEAVKVAWEIIHILGGVIVDEWLRRIDFCIDIPDFDLRKELLPAVLLRHVIKTARGSCVHSLDDSESGFTIGSLPHIRINVYDKKFDTFARHGELYQQAMIDRRWNGNIPECATRVEWQCGNQWLAGFDSRSAIAALNDPGAIIERLVSVGPEPRCLFRLTERDPDRQNGNQSRAGVLPQWQWVVDRMREWSGPANVRLQRIRRDAISFERAYRVIVGTLTTVADVRGICVSNISDLVQLLYQLFVLNGTDNDSIADRWMKKAKRSGTYDEVRKPKDAA